VVPVLHSPAMLLLFLACPDADTGTKADLSADTSSLDTSVEDIPSDTGDDSAADTAPPVDTADDTGVDTAMADTADTGEGATPIDCAREALSFDHEGELSSDTTWCAIDTVHIRGPVTVASGVHLAIEAGTTVHATWGTDGSPGELIVGQGATIDAVGTEDATIVIRPLGDGSDPTEFEGFEVVGYGRSPENPSDDPTDGSGVMSYIRVEYGGNTDAAIHFVSVGEGTEVDHLASLYSYDDAFEFDGGELDAKYLVAYEFADDGYQFEDGYDGHLHHCLAAEGGGAGITVRNRDPDDGGGHGDEPRTYANVNNFTIVNTYSEGIYLDNGGQGEFTNMLVSSPAECTLKVDDASVENLDEGLELGFAVLWQGTTTFCLTDLGVDISGYAHDYVVADPLLDGYELTPESPAWDPAYVDEDDDDQVGAFSDWDWSNGWAVPE